MEHVRLPLTSKEYLLKRVDDEPLLRIDSQCKNLKKKIEKNFILNYKIYIVNKIIIILKAKIT